MKLFLQLLLFLASLLMCGCSDDQPLKTVCFDKGPIASISLPPRFHIDRQTDKPWVLYVSSDDDRSFSLQAVVPGDDNFENIGNLPQAYSALRDFARKLTVNGREWVIISDALKGVIAYSLEDDMRLYFLAAGDWKGSLADRVILSIKTRDSKLGQ